MGKVLPIYIHPHPVLQRVAEPIAATDAATLTLAEDMFATLAVANGAALAAPQVGASVRLIVVDLGAESPNGRRDYSIKHPEVLINPEITHTSEATCMWKEGCLSVPDLWLDIERHAEVSLRYTDRDGQVREEHATGIRALMVQHEIDHLNGIMFTDRLSPARRLMAMPKWQKLRTDILRKGAAFDVIAAECGLIKAKHYED